MKIFFLLERVWSEYTVNVWSQSKWVNPGENYTAYCNIPGQEALDIIYNLKVKWFHNDQVLTSFCEFLSSELAQKYFCKVPSPQKNNFRFKNISMVLTVTSKTKCI